TRRPLPRRQRASSLMASRRRNGAFSSARTPSSSTTGSAQHPRTLTAPSSTRRFAGVAGGEFSLGRAARGAAMSFALTAEQQEIRTAVARLCERFDDEYWLRKDTDGGFPLEFHQAMAKAGWLGIAMPEAYGGSGLGMTEAAILMQAVAQS